MAAMAPNVGELTGGQREARWDSLRPFIQKLYMEDGWKLKDVITEVEKRHGFVATRWGMSKYVPAESWPYIGYHLEKRRREGKARTEVVLSGVRMSAQRIKKALRRNCGTRAPWETLALIPRPKTPEEVEMLIRTPPPSQAHMSRELPWMEFMYQFGTALDSFSRITLSPSASNKTAMGLSTSLGAELPSQILPGKCSWHAFQNEFMPPVPASGSANKDRQLWDSRRYIGGDMALSPVSDLQGLFFALSNNLINNNEGQYQTIIDLFKGSRLPVSTLRRLYKSGLFSVKASLDRLFEYAVMALDVEVTRNLLQAGASPFREFRLSPSTFDKNNPIRQSIMNLRYSNLDSPVLDMTAFQMALAAGHRDLIDLLLPYGAAKHGPEELETNVPLPPSRVWPTTLRCAVLACERNPEFGPQMLRYCLAQAPKPSCDKLYDCLNISVRVQNPVSAGILLNELFSRREFGQSQPPPAVLRAAMLAGDDTKAMRIVDLGLDECSLASAVRAGDGELVRFLLSRGVDVNAGTPSPLQAAAFSDKPDILEMLISAGGDVNHIQHRLSVTSPHDGKKYKYGFDEAQQEWFGIPPTDDVTGQRLGFTALGAAIMADDEEMIDTLREYGAIPCQADLTSAIGKGITEFVHDHIDAGGRVTWPVGTLETPLAASLLAGHISLAEKILQADTRQYDPAAIVTGIFMASQPGVLGMVWELLSRRRGYYEHHHPEGLSKIIHRCWEGMALSAAAMMSGCIAGGRELVQAFLDCGIRRDVNPSMWFYSEARDALASMLEFHCHPALSSSQFYLPPRKYWHTHCSALVAISGDMGVLKLLWPEDKVAWNDCLSKAVMLEWRELITSLLAEGKSKGYYRGPSSLDWFLISAAHIGSLDVVRLLVYEGADVNAGGYDQTALSAAVDKGADDVIDFLLARGADVNAHAHLNGARTTALRSACYNGKLALVRRLLDLGARLDERDCPPGCNSPFTPLCAAADRGRLDILQVLLNAGALSPYGEVETRLDYVRAVMLALSNNQNAAAELLKSFGGWGTEEEVLRGQVSADFDAGSEDSEDKVPRTLDDFLEDWRDVIEDGGWEAPSSPPGMALSASSDLELHTLDEEQGEMSAMGTAAADVMKENIEGVEHGGHADGAVEEGESFTAWLAQTGFYDTAEGEEQGKVDEWFSPFVNPDALGYSELQESGDGSIGGWS